jgi:hypothetical protein
MAIDKNVNIIPITIESVGGDEEKFRRITTEAIRLANLAPGEWRLWYRREAAKFGIAEEQLAELVTAQIAAREKAAAEKLAKDKLTEQRAERLRKIAAQEQREKRKKEEAAAKQAEKKAKEKAKAFADIIKLASNQHDSKLEELAKKLDESFDALKAEFNAYCTAEVAGAMPLDAVESWPDPVDTGELLKNLITCIHTHVRIRTQDGELIVALWVLMAWVHEEIAHHSVYLGATSPKDDCGKTTLIVETVGRLVPKPWISGADPTVSTIFRTADRLKPTMAFDNVDNLFERKREITDLFLNGWTRGIPYIRNEKINGEWVPVPYDPFTAKCFTLIGGDLPRPLLGRSLLIETWPLKLGDEVVEVDPFDEELMEAFKTLQRKATRWSQDNVAALKTAKPTFPPGFTTRPRANAKLLLAIAELAGDAYAERARTALDKLLREKKPDWLELLLQELWTVFVTERRNEITSDQLVKRLSADPTSEWREYGRSGHRVTQREVAVLLRKLHIHTAQVGKARVSGYRASKFIETEIFQHFLHRDPLIPSPSKKRG